MANYDLQEIMENTEGNEHIILYLEANNENEALQSIYDYKIYNNLLDKLFEICNEDYEHLAISLLVINARPYITKEMVHDNLTMENPIPFAKQLYKDEKHPIVKQICYLFEATTFYQEYTALKKNQNNQNKKR